MAKKLKVQKKKAQNTAKKTWTVIIICVVVALIGAIVLGVVTVNNYVNADTPVTDNADSAGFGATAPDLTVTDKVEISVEGYGVMKAELYGNEAPISVENFMNYVNSGYYDGSTFHRIIKDFMIQGGQNYTTPTNEPIKGEFTENGVKNNIPHERGVLSMARTTDPNSATSQFFICHETNMNVTYSLDGKYAAFGKVYEGLDVLDAIANVECSLGADGAMSAPVETVTIEYIKEITD